PLISFTMNMAGPVKLTALSHRSFVWGLEQLRLGFLQNQFQILAEQQRSLPTGDEAYFAIDAPAERVKALCVEIEESSPMGRFFDMDVIGGDGCKLERGVERSCIVCGKPGRDCASRRLHTVAELQTATSTQLAAGLQEQDQRRVASFATQALLGEVAVSPKPGLVDRFSNGAHRDMDFFDFLASASTLQFYWAQCFNRGRQDALRSEQDGLCAPDETFSALRPAGRQAEREMLAATGGVNTHKGAIFTLGVLCAALGRCWRVETDTPGVERILREAAAMTKETLAAELPTADWNTAGEDLYRAYGTRGIRGEVADGLPAVRELALPVFQTLLARGLDRNHAAAVTLLHLIARVEDTNLLHRGGLTGAEWAKQAAQKLIADGSIPSLSAILDLDAQFTAQNLSPGGCADLLAVTLFLDSLCNRISLTENICIF
ncbi:MAG: triphosphoribosyl-dephospho-CoA synthase, partial [Oscillospiraceae bacterium]|nr:triphosphoribosyl-dephospho-CoA synthase [Oscillospiraceae bacterium]